jgi:hypothetical protein
MRRILIALAVVAFSSAMAAQTTITGLTVKSVIHEPSKTEAGPYLSSLMRDNPAFDSLQPTGEPDKVPLIGNGNGLHHLDSVSGELYALGGTTTHDLIILTNNSGGDVIVDLDYGIPGVNPGSPGALTLSSSQAAVSPPEAPQQASPDPNAFGQFGYGSDVYTGSNPLNGIVGYDAAAVSVPNGSSVAICLLVIKWSNYLDTSPRDYVLNFTFLDGATGDPAVFEVKMTVPKASDEEGGCQVSTGNLPSGLALVAGGTMAAILLRRKLLEKARAK